MSDPLLITAQGYKVLVRTGTHQDVAEILHIASENDVIGIVCGLPMNMNGTLGPQAEQVLEFIHLLEESTDIPIYQQDERLTSKSAENALLESGMTRKKRKEKIDKIAAAIILQVFISKQPGSFSES